MSYFDFELEIGFGKGRDYPVAVIHSPAGEAREKMTFPFDHLVLENRLKDLQIALLRSGGKRRRVNLPEVQTVQDFGRDLFQSLICGEARSRYDVSLNKASQQGKGLRIKLRIQSPELSALPWEFMFDDRLGDYLCLSKKTPVVRYIELPQPIQPVNVTLPLRILGMIASPKDLPTLDVDREKLRIKKAIASLEEAGLIELTWLAGQSWRELQRTMRHGPWHVFHFIGHGGFDTEADEGLICLSNEEGKKHFMSATQLGRLLADHDPLRLVLLNSCEGARGGERDIFSSSASILVQRGIPAVIAMQYEVTDRAAIEFSRSFYEALADGYPIDASVAEARKSVSLAINNTLEWGIPVLYMRSPDGVLFTLTQKTEEKEPVSDEKKALPEVPLSPEEPSSSGIAEPDKSPEKKKKTTKILPPTQKESCPIDTVISEKTPQKNKKKKAKAPKPAGDIPQEAEEGLNAEEMYNKGVMYEEGKGVKQDFKEAIKWYRKAVKVGHVASMYKLGYMYSSGKGIRKSYVNAVPLYQKAAEAGNVEAMHELAFMYELGIGVKQDYKKAKSWCQKAAEAGDDRAMHILGDMYYNGTGVKKDYKESMRWHLKAAKLGHIDAMYCVAAMYDNGEGEEQDFKKAAQWYRKGAEAGDSEAMYQLGLMLEIGMGIKKNVAEAVRWVRKAAEADNIEAMNYLGFLYEQGTGVKKNYKEAERWYRIAADAGQSDAMYSLGVMYDNGTGVKKNVKEAVRWIRKAAEAGNAVAMDYLGIMYRYGTGVKENVNEAISWFRKAAKAGDEHAVAQLKELGVKL